MSPIFLTAQNETDVDDYEIINLFVDRYSKPFYYSDTDERYHFNLNKVLGNEFNQKCLGTLKDHRRRYIYMDSILKSNETTNPDYGLLRDNYKNGLILSKEEIVYFETYDFTAIPKKTVHPKKLKSYAIVLEEFSATENTVEMSRGVTLKGPFYNSTRDKAFLDWYAGSSNCILYIKECGIWREVGNFNYGLH